MEKERMSPQIIKQIEEEITKLHEELTPIFNNGECKKSCNCIEIAEFKNGNFPVKQFQCLKAL